MLVFRVEYGTRQARVIDPETAMHLSESSSRPVFATTQARGRPASKSKNLVELGMSRHQDERKWWNTRWGQSFAGRPLLTPEYSMIVYVANMTSSLERSKSLHSATATPTQPRRTLGPQGSDGLQLGHQARLALKSRRLLVVVVIQRDSLVLR